jgi:hypothetical protein
LENAQAMAAHESPRTTKLHDRTGDEIPLDEVERITIEVMNEISHRAIETNGIRMHVAEKGPVALLSKFGPVVLMDFGPPPVPQPTVARVYREAWRGLESQSGFVRAAASGA